MPRGANLGTRAIFWTFLTELIFGAAFFLPAGTWRFWQAWVYLALLNIAIIPGSFYFYKHDPRLVERRLQMREKVPEQKRIMRFASVVFFVAFALPGLDRRFGWSHEPLWLTIFAQAIMFAGLLLASWVPIVNRYAARTIQVEAGQQVVTTGPYRFVRHPMYLGSLVMFLFTPLALGSYWTLPVFALILPVVVLRLLNEETVLRRELAGYAEYCGQTRYRLIPHAW